MKIIFVDTNVIIDFLANRKPFSISAAKLFTLSLQKKIKIYISAVSYNNIYYILRQSIGHKQTLFLLTELLAMTEIVDVTKQVIEASTKGDFNDFEDAIQYNCAISNNKIEAIITRNIKDYKKSCISVLTTDELMHYLDNNKK